MCLQGSVVGERPQQSLWKIPPMTNVRHPPWVKRHPPWVKRHPPSPCPPRDFLNMLLASKYIFHYQTSVHVHTVEWRKEYIRKSIVFYIRQKKGAVKSSHPVIWFWDLSPSLLGSRHSPSNSTPNHLATSGKAFENSSRGTPWLEPTIPDKPRLG